MSGSNPVVVAFIGDLDFTVRETLRARLAELAEGDPAIVDLTQVDYMDSLALAELVLLHRVRQNAGRSAPRVVVGQRIARLYEISGIAMIMPPYPSVSEAQTG
ncbi:MAG TPA: STAS domain-containing protein [Candidatus Baltobacteraceae bacterium]